MAEALEDFGQQFCPSCESYKQRTAFKADPTCVGGRRKTCRACAGASREAREDWDAMGPDEAREHYVYVDPGEAVICEPRDPDALRADSDAVAVILTDQQIIGHHRGYDAWLHDATLKFLDAERPDTLVIGGDFLDFPSLSTHLPNPFTHGTMREGIEAGAEVLADYIQAAGPTCANIVYLAGNHEERLRKYLLRRADAVMDYLGSISVPTLLHLESLGVEWVTGPTGEWPFAQYALSETCAVRHGSDARSASGASVLAQLQRCTYSLVVGHSQRQAIVGQTRWNVHGEPVVLYGVEAGTLAEPRGGLGYAVEPNWQQGFAVVYVHPDESIYPALVTYQDKKLRMGGRAY